MKKKIKTIAAPKKEILIKKDEEVYRQLNTISFEKNFRVLITHFKKNEQIAHAN